jgi:hypothetical protein
MEQKRASRETALEEAYRRGYHHGLVQTLELMHGLLLSGMPASGVTELCRAFEERVVIPWRMTADSSGSAPPRFVSFICFSYRNLVSPRAQIGPSNIHASSLYCFDCE